MKNVNDISEKEIYDLEFLRVNEFLKSRFEEPFEYKIWDEKDLIGVNFRGKLYQYCYTYENTKLNIEELEVWILYNYQEI